MDATHLDLASFLEQGRVAHHLSQFFLECIDVSCDVPDLGSLLLPTHFEFSIHWEVASVGSADVEGQFLVLGRSQGLIQVEIGVLIKNVECGFSLVRCLGNCFSWDFEIEVSLCFPDGFHRV